MFIGGRRLKEARAHFNMRGILFLYKYMYPLHNQKLNKNRCSPDTKIYKGCLGFIK